MSFGYMQYRMQPREVTLTQLSRPSSDTEQLDATQEETYPQGTFEALLVITVDRCKNLQELQDALLVI